MAFENLRLETRLAAIEYLLCDLWAKHYLRIGASYEQVVEAHGRAIDRLKTQTFPGIDPALSDLASSELEEAVCALLLMQRQMLEGAIDKLDGPKS